MNEPAHKQADLPRRVEYRDEVERLQRDTLEGIELVVGALDRSLEALAHQDIELADLVVADDDQIDGRYLQIHQGVLSLLARQTPVAADLRLLAALLHVIRNMERMGDQCVNISKLIPVTGHDPSTDPEILRMIEEMGLAVREIVRQAMKAFQDQDPSLAADLAERDLKVNQLNRAIFRRALEVGGDIDLREWAMTMTLVARCLERVGDNAVDIGEQIAFVVTGVFREFADASQSERGEPSRG
jgi:phosphate transport system protein